MVGKQSNSVINVKVTHTRYGQLKHQTKQISYVQTKTKWYEQKLWLRHQTRQISYDMCKPRHKWYEQKLWLKHQTRQNSYDKCKPRLNDMNRNCDWSIKTDKILLSIKVAIYHCGWSQTCHNYYTGRRCVYMYTNCCASNVYMLYYPHFNGLHCMKWF